MPFAIRRLIEADAPAYRALRLASLETDPASFGADPVAEAALPLSAFVERIAQQAVFGAFAGAELVGMAAFRQETGAKERHKAVVRGVYVHRDWRGQGVASALFTTLIDEARAVVERLTLVVVQGNESAIAVYRRHGFSIYGVEPMARKHEGQYIDKVLMGRGL